MIGDSITRGYDASGGQSDPSYNGYRPTLDTDAIASGFTSLQWVGQQNNSTASYVPTRLHEGINGDSCNDKLPGAGTPNSAGFATNPIDNYLGSGKPLHGVDIVMINIGTNLFDSGTFAADYLALAQAIHSREPQARFVCGTVFSGGKATVNPLLPSLWAQMRSLGMYVYTCDPNATMVAGDLADGIHPNAAGYTKLGHIWSPALIRALQGATSS